MAQEPEHGRCDATHRSVDRIDGFTSLGERLVSWAGELAILALLSAAFSWLIGRIDAVAVHGWAAVVMAGIGVALVLMLVLSFGLVAWRIHRPIRKASSDDEPNTAPPPPKADSLTPDGSLIRDQIGDRPTSAARLEPAVATLEHGTPPHDHSDDIRQLGARLGSAERSISGNRRKISTADGDIFILVDFAIHQAAAARLADLLRKAPEERDELEFSENTRNAANDFVDLVLETVGDSVDRRKRLTALLNQAAGEVEHKLQNVPWRQRRRVDPLAYRGWAIAVSQLRQTVAFLDREKNEIDAKLLRQRPALLEIYERRDPS